MVANIFRGALKSISGKVKRVGRSKAKPANKAEIDAGQAMPKHEPGAAAAVNPGPSTVAVTAASLQPKVKKIEKRFGTFLLDVSNEEFEAASEYFSKNPTEVKIRKGTKLKTRSGKEIELTYSMVGIKGVNDLVEPYAMANGEYLGEGAYGRVKVAQKRDGKTFAVKIEGKGKSAEDSAEETISKWIGYLVGTGTRKLAQKKTFKGKETEDKTYSVYQLRKGKEIFEQLYTNVLTPGQLYTKEEQDQLRRKEGESLSETQRILIAFKSCQVVQDLHNRGVIHGDLKPANLMADIDGHQIVVGAIDYGFSMKLDRNRIPPETVIERDGAPEGTHPRYMPPEVRVGSKNSDSFQPGQKTHFSTASDVYSLGVMFADDMQLPVEITGAMTSDNPDGRSSLYDVMDNLVTRLESLPAAQRTPEIEKIIHEHRFGVKRMHEASGPAQQASFVAQLLSGFRDPRESIGDANNSSSYATDEYQEMAIGIFDVMTPKAFYSELNKAFAALEANEDKDIFVHNAGLLISEILKADIGNEHKQKNVQGITEFSVLLDPDRKAKFDIMINEALNATRVAEAAPAARAAEQPIDIINYIEQTLQSDAVNQAEMSNMVDVYTDELKEIMVKLFLDINPFDFHGKKIEKDKNRDLGYTKISAVFNSFSNKVINDIITAKSKAHQLKVYEFYARVLQQLVEKGEYNLAQAINSAFNSAAINVLGYLRDNPEVSAIVQNARGILDPQKAYKAMREDVQKKTQAGVAVVPLLSSLNGDLTFAKENKPISEVTQKVNGDKVQLLGRFINERIIANQQRMRMTPRKEPRTNVAQQLATPVAEINYYYNLAKSYFPSKATEPDFSKVSANPSISQKIADDTPAIMERIATLKNNIMVINATAATELAAMDDADIAELIDCREKYIEYSAAVKGYCDTDKNNSVVIAEALKIDIDEDRVSAVNQAIKAYLAKQIDKFNAGELDENQVDDLYNIVIMPNIFSDFTYADIVLPFKKSVEEQRAIEFFQDKETAKQFRNLLNQYARAIFASESNEVTKNDDAVKGNLMQWKREIEEIINKVNRGLNSSNENIKALAISYNSEIKPMIDKYDQLQEQLKKPAPASPVESRNNKKSSRNLARSLVRRVKALRNSSSTKVVTDSGPTTMDLIKSLHEETLKFTRQEAPPERKAAELPVTPIESEIGIEVDDKPVKRRVRFADEEAKEHSSEHDDSVDSVNAAEIDNSYLNAAEEVDDVDEQSDEIPFAMVVQQPAVDSVHQQAFAQFQNFQEMLSDSTLEQRNQIKVEAMKSGVRFLLALPKENKPRNFLDIVNKAMVAAPSSSIDMTTKEAAKTILAAIISPEADLNQLTAYAGKMSHKVEMLKQTDPMTPQVKKKIALREDVLKYLRTRIDDKTLQLSPASRAQAERAQPVTPAQLNERTEQRIRSAGNTSVNEPMIHLKQGIEDFEKLIEKMNDPENRKFFVEDAKPSTVLMNKMLIELKRLNPKTATADDVERIYLQGIKYWKQEGNQPLRDNPLIKLRDNLPKQQPGVRHSF